MAHIIAEVIIENGKLEYVDKKLPRGRIKAHIIYDINEKKTSSKRDTTRIINETSGIYKHIDAETECRALREDWERNAKG